MDNNNKDNILIKLNMHGLFHIFRARYWFHCVVLGIFAGQMSVGTLFAQEADLNKELILVRPYEPSVSDAQKINILPGLNDTFKIKPVFMPTIYSRRIDTRFNVSPISAAKLQSLPQPKLYRTYTKAGIGTNSRLLGQFAFNTVRNKEYALGAMLQFDGSASKVKLDNDEKVAAGYTETGAQVFGKKFFRSSYLYGDLGMSGLSNLNYGYDTERIDTAFVKGDIKKRYTFADAKIGIRSSHFKTDKLNFDAQLGYHYTHNKTDSRGDWDTIPKGRKFNENAIGLKATLDNNMFGGNLDLDIYERTGGFDSLQSNFAIGLNPWFIMDNDSIRLEVGMRLAAYKEGDHGMQLKIYPKVEFQFTLLKDIFIPFVGIDGNMRTSTYGSLVKENPFITPGLVAPITNVKLQIYGGLKGTLTSKLAYYLRVNFATSEKEHFFVNDSAYSLAQNYFTVVTDNMNIFSFNGELFYNPVESIELGIKANYHSYQPTVEKKAWHRPAFTGEFFAKYNLRNKVLVNFELIGIGERYAKIFGDPNKNMEVLKSAADLNFGVEYRYTKSLSFFLNLNNLTGAKYYRWNYYPSQRFNAMIGFTYSL
jgi:hypothetical protein